MTPPTKKLESPADGVRQRAAAREPAVLPGHFAEPIWRGGGTGAPGGPAETGRRRLAAYRGGKAFRPRPGICPGAQPRIDALRAGDPGFSGLTIISARRRCRTFRDVPFFQLHFRAVVGTVNRWTTCRSRSVKNSVWGERGGYYEEAAAPLRDMVQNHMLQVLALIAMGAAGLVGRAESVRPMKR